MYADDTTIYSNLEDFPIENREILINNELEKVNKWLKLNKLAVSVDKTKSMLFHKRRPVTPIQFSMNNKIIDVVQYFNYLGSMLDADMSLKTHVVMVRNKLSRINGILHRLKEIYPQNILSHFINLYFFLTLTMDHCFWDMRGTIRQNKKRLLELALHTVIILRILSHF